MPTHVSGRSEKFLSVGRMAVSRLAPQLPPFRGWTSIPEAIVPPPISHGPHWDCRGVFGGQVHTGIPQNGTSRLGGLCKHGQPEQGSGPCLGDSPHVPGTPWEGLCLQATVTQPETPEPYNEAPLSWWIPGPMGGSDKVTTETVLPRPPTLIQHYPWSHHGLARFRQPIRKQRKPRDQYWRFGSLSLTWAFRRYLGMFVNQLPP